VNKEQMRLQQPKKTHAKKLVLELSSCFKSRWKTSIIDNTNEAPFTTYFQ
jgi:hypothetical protein